MRRDLRMAELQYIHTTMNGRKSAELIMRVFSLQGQQKEVLVFKPRLDTRDGDAVKSRALDTEIPATLVGGEEKGKMFELAKKHRPLYIFVDEAQFLTAEQVLELVSIVDELKIDVYSYGLLVDFRGVLFEGSKALIENADTISDMPNVCIYCTNKAIRNMRLLNSRPVFHGEVVQVGFEESYRSICRECYNSFQATSQM